MGYNFFITMAKNKLPRPIHFQMDCPWPSKQSMVVEAQAKQRFKELVDKGCYADLYLIYSSHWASQGIWIEFKLPNLHALDVLIKHVHNKNPKPWIPPPPPITDDEEDEEE